MEPLKTGFLQTQLPLFANSPAGIGPAQPTFDVPVDLALAGRDASEPTPFKQTDFSGVVKDVVSQYLQADTLDQVAQKGAQLKEMARNMVSLDRQEVLGSNPDSMLSNFQMEPGDLPNPEHVWQMAGTVLNELSAKVLNHVKDGQYQELNPERMSIDRKMDALSQHVGYTVGVLRRDESLPVKPNPEISRILLRKYFDGSLSDTSGAAVPPRELLANELSKAANDSQEVKNKVLAPENDYLFSKENTLGPASLLSNQASVHAGEATLEFATHLFDGNEERGAAFVKNVFGRPDEELQQLLKDPQGKEGLLLHFAATAHHLAWEFSKLGTAYVRAKAGEERAVKDWNHPDIGPTRNELAGNDQAARKVADQIQAFLIRQGRLVPCDRDSQQSGISLSQLLDQVEKNGIYSDNGKLRVISPAANMVSQRLHDDVQVAAKLSDWKAGGELSADMVAHTCAAFAAQATKADFEERENLVRLYRDGISRFMPEVDKLLEKGVPDKQDEAYKALYQDLAGEFSFETLKDNLGVARANELARSAKFGHLIPVACEALRLPVRGDYTPANLVEDVVEMQKTILKDDYFLSKPEFVGELRREAAEPLAEVNPKDLQNSVRVPNAMWMWTQVLRGLVEHKPQRYTVEKADFNSDKFPNQVQLNPPDTRDVELFAWARHRLKENGYDAARATRMATALVVLTLHKDLLQIRKASQS